MKIGVYEWTFDDVQLGIDVKYWRLAHEKDQSWVAKQLPHKPTDAWVSALERGKLTEGIPMNKFMALCRMMDTDPREYFAIERALV